MVPAANAARPVLDTARAAPAGVGRERPDGLAAVVAGPLASAAACVAAVAAIGSFVPAVARRCGRVGLQLLVWNRAILLSLWFT